MAAKQLADYLQYMQTDDILAATERAKVQARILLEDQGVAALALLLADVLADAIHQRTDEVSNAVVTRSSVLS